MQKYSLLFELAKKYLATKKKEKNEQKMNSFPFFCKINQNLKANVSI